MKKLTLQMPYQLFIGGEFVDAEGAKTYNTINPTDGSVSRLQPPSFHPPPTYLLGTVANSLVWRPPSASLPQTEVCMWQTFLTMNLSCHAQCI